MLLPDLHASILAFVDATRPWAATHQDVARHIEQTGRKDALTSVCLRINAPAGLILRGWIPENPATPSHHTIFHTAVQMQPARHAAHTLRDTLLAHAPILVTSPLDLRERVGQHRTVWTCNLASGTPSVVRDTPEGIATALCAMAHLLKDRPRGTRCFYATDASNNTLHLFAASLEDALALWYANHLFAPDFHLHSLTEVFDMDHIRAAHPDPRHAYTTGP